MNAPAGFPDFSPAMLRGFLQARVVIRAAERQIDAEIAEKQIARETADAAGEAVETVRQAMAGRLKRAGARAAIWAALGIFPADHGVMLTDNGGQMHG